ncbi:hypothetical protein JL720_15173 [Aureococcus anophagefferens]|nr:hypothetical protein JL720_15173 [Aureococcus anophagefferens]
MGLCRIFCEMGEAYMPMIASERDCNQLAIVSVMIKCTESRGAARFWYHSRARSGAWPTATRASLVAKFRAYASLARLCFLLDELAALPAQAPAKGDHSSQAARALKRLCDKCAPELGQAGALTIRDTLTNRVPLKDELEILEGLGAVVAAMPDYEAVRGHGAARGPAGARFDGDRVAERGGRAARRRASSTASRRCRKLCRCYKHAMRSCRKAFAPMLSRMAAHLVQSFASNPISSFIYCSSICITEFGDEAEKRRRFDMFAAVVGGFGLLSTPEAYAAAPDVVEEYFYLARRDAPQSQQDVDDARRHAATLHGLLVVEASGAALTDGLLKALSGDLPSYIKDEGRGSLLGVLWKLRLVCPPESFAAWCSTSLAVITDKFASHEITNDPLVRAEPPQHRLLRRLSLLLRSAR